MYQLGDIRRVDKIFDQLVVGGGQKSPNGGYNRLGMRESRARHLRSEEDAPK